MPSCRKRRVTSRPSRSGSITSRIIKSGAASWAAASAARPVDASRSAPMGAVPADVVIATFFNFNPELIRRVIPAAWDITSPGQILAARLEGADRALHRALGDGIGSPEVKEAAELARQAAEVACQHPEGRPLFAGHA